MNFISAFISRLKRTSPGSKTASVAIDPAKVKRRRNNPYDRTSNPALKGRSSAAHVERHRDGNSPALLGFIRVQCDTMAGFDHAKFFDLCEINGVPKPWVDQYRAVVLKDGSSWGRAFMLFRNRLGQIARWKGKLLDLAGNEIKIDLSEEASPVHEPQDSRSAGVPPHG